MVWVRTVQRVGYITDGTGYESSQLVYESSGYEVSMGTKRLDSHPSINNSVLYLNTGIERFDNHDNNEWKKNI